MVNTIEENLQFLTPRQQQQAYKARKLYHALGVGARRPEQVGDGGSSQILDSTPTEILDSTPTEIPRAVDSTPIEHYTPTTKEYNFPTPTTGEYGIKHTPTPSSKNETQTAVKKKSYADAARSMTHTKVKKPTMTARNKNNKVHAGRSKQGSSFPVVNEITDSVY